MDNKAGKTVVKAEVPMSEMLTYGTDLTSMTQGRGSFSMEMDHYDYRSGAAAGEDHRRSQGRPRRSGGRRGVTAPELVRIHRHPCGMISTLFKLTAVLVPIT